MCGCLESDDDKKKLPAQQATYLKRRKYINGRPITVFKPRPKK